MPKEKVVDNFKQYSENQAISLIKHPGTSKKSKN